MGDPGANPGADWKRDICVLECTH